MDYKVIKNKYGYYEIKNKPTSDFLVNYYREKYYSESSNKLNKYEKNYSEEELLFKSNQANRKREILLKHRPRWENAKFKILDIGCGEGWNLKYFNKMGCDVLGVEYQSDACTNLNPEVSKKVLTGDIWENIDSIIDKGETYEVVILDNVLEHVLYPEKRLKSIKRLLAKDGILIIEVPNDYSILQHRLKAVGNIKDDYWVAPPDHLSYFNMEGLNLLLEQSGYHLLEQSCDYPIDLNLFNSDTNYVIDKRKGRNVHLSRISIENFFDSISVDLTIELYSTLAKMGLGRNISGYYSIL